jgi:Transglutaminase-like superfamily
VSGDEGLSSSAVVPAAVESRSAPVAEIRSPLSLAPNQRERIFWVVWRLCSLLLIASVLFLAYSAAWEFSTRRYLKGFSDAIVPADSAPIDKMQAILTWMSKSPARKEAGPSGAAPDRDPADTLNYASLLDVCGTATNAFINLADSTGLPARRLLLLDANRATVHVVAEVRIDGRWIIIDPAFRFIPRGPDGGLLTRTQLADPKIFSFATSKIPNYDPGYNYQSTVHVRLARVPYIGRTLRRTLNALVPGWSDSSMVSLILERDSLALFALSLVLVAYFAAARLLLRWYAASLLSLHPPHAYRRLAMACANIFDLAT